MSELIKVVTKSGTNLQFQVPSGSRDKLLSVVHKLEDGIHYNDVEIFQDGMRELLELLSVRGIKVD